MKSYKYNVKVQIGEIPNEIKQIELRNLMCKHVLAIKEIGTISSNVLTESMKAGYVDCRWGNKDKRFKLKHHINTIVEIERTKDIHPLRIILTSYEFSVNTYIWADNLYTALVHLRNNINITLGEIPLSIIDISRSTTYILGELQNLPTLNSEMMSIIALAYKRYEESNYKPLVDLNYTLDKFIKDNPEIIKKEETLCI